MAWYSILFYASVLIIVFFLFGWLVYDRDQERKQVRDAAYQEGIGEEFDLEFDATIRASGF